MKIIPDYQLRAKAQKEKNKRKAERSKQYASEQEFYQTHPYEYLIERLQFRPETINWSLNPGYEKHKWDGTKDPLMVLLQAIADNKWVTVRSAVGTNKTRTAAGIVLWFLDCFPGSRVITTAPKESQLLSQIWGEINTLYPFFNKGKLTSGLLKMEDKVNTNWKAEAFVTGLVASEDSLTKAQGFHAPDMLILVEETPGVPKQALTALINTSTGRHNILVFLGNPDNQMDNFSLLENMDNVVNIQISGYDHPNVVTKNPDLIPGAQTERGIQTMLSLYRSKEHPLFISRARGMTPIGSANSLIKYQWIMKAVERYNLLCDEHDSLIPDEVLKYNLLRNMENDPSLGVDVANSEAGDDASICEGIGAVNTGIESFPCPNSNQLGHQVAKLASENGIESNKVWVDGIGVGAGTVNTLVDDHDFPIEDINFQSSAAPIDIPGNNEIFLNKRSQAWWMTAEGFRLGIIAMPEDKETIADLVSPKWFVKNGKIVIESKEDIKKRLLRSPNKGDAFVYWYWNNIELPKVYNINMG